MASDFGMRLDRGVSLLELLIAMTITVGTGAAVFQLVQQNEGVFHDQMLIVEMNQAARVVAGQIADDVRIAGQSTPLAVGNIVLPGSGMHRLNLRAGFNGTETPITTLPPISATLGAPLTLTVEQTAGFSSGRDVYVWNRLSWIRANVMSLSSPARRLQLLPTQGSGRAVTFQTPPSVALDEGIAIFYDPPTRTIRRTTASDTANPGNPPWAPANELAAQASALQFSYFDANGQSVDLNGEEARARVVTIEARIEIQTAAALRNGSRPSCVLSVRVSPWNLNLDQL